MRNAPNPAELQHGPHNERRHGLMVVFLVFTVAEQPPHERLRERPAHPTIVLLQELLASRLLGARSFGLDLVPTRAGGG